MPIVLKEFFVKFVTVSLISSALIITVQLISPLLKKRYSARWRYWVWLLLSVWLLAPVTFPIGQAPIQISVSDTAIIQPVAQTPPVNNESQSDYITQDIAPKDNASQANPVPTSETETSTLYAILSSFIARFTILDLLIMIWAAGAVIVLFYRWIAALRFRSRLRRKWRPCDSRNVARCVRRVMEEMGFHKEIDLKFSKEVKSPFMTGLFHPVLVLPDQAFDPYLLIHIIRHELTHYRRLDLWYKSIINFVTALHWFNPMTHVMNRASDRDLELICDEIVTRGQNLNSRKDYGESILLTVKPGLDKRPVALTTSFSRGAKNLKERFESIMQIKAKNSGIAFLAIIIMLAVLASGCTVVNIQKIDWTLYTNTEWRSEYAEADLYFKDMGKKGIVFDLYISQMCIVENAETAGKLKINDEGYVDSYSGEYGGTSVKASVTFSPDGDYVIVTLTEVGRIPCNETYRFVRANAISLEELCGGFYGNGMLLSLSLDGTARIEYHTGALFNEESTGTFTIENNKIIYKRISDNRPRIEGGTFAINEKYDLLPETTVIMIIDYNTLEVEEGYFSTLGFSFTKEERTLSRMKRV